VRAVLADDAALMREGIALVLASAGIEIVGQATNAEELLQLSQDLQPDLAIVDVHMPPTDAIQGLEAAIRIREKHPRTNVLLLSADFEPRYAQRLLAASPAGVGYLVKERVSDVTEFAAAARRVAAGGVAFEADLFRGSERVSG
jgi:DNA-binding NarL/FixJ family response regulator